MAKYIVKPHGDRPPLVKCSNCNTLYAPDLNVHPYGDPDYFEKCPMCGYGWNKWCDTIPLWKYNLIKWFRGCRQND